MKQCTPTAAVSELSFARDYMARRESGACAGPILVLVLGDWQIYSISRIMAHPLADDILWNGFVRSDLGGSRFRLCAAHWFDLASLAFAQAVTRHRADWVQAAEELLRDLCMAARWDPKEVVNMFVWQQQG